MIHETCLLSAKQATFRKMEKFVERFWSWAWLSIRVTAASIPKMIRKYSLRTFTTWFSSIYVFLRIVSSHSYQNLYQSRLQALNIPIQNTKKGVAPWHLTEGVQKGGHRWGHRVAMTLPMACQLGHVIAHGRTATAIQAFLEGDDV
jgi:hypothetical protein